MDAKGDTEPGVCGPRLRTITACQGAAVCPSGCIDTYALAKELDGRYFALIPANPVPRPAPIPAKNVTITVNKILISFYSPFDTYSDFSLSVPSPVRRFFVTPQAPRKITFRKIPSVFHIPASIRVLLSLYRSVLSFSGLPAPPGVRDILPAPVVPHGQIPDLS